MKLDRQKVLIIGVSGMLGHAVARRFSEQADQFEVLGTLRGSDLPDPNNRFQKITLCKNVDAQSMDTLTSVFSAHSPDIVINCLGLVKQRPNAEEPVDAITLNALFPHQLAKLCASHNARLIQISTDCVFTGKDGNYSEDDVPDAADFYGRSKLLGEVAYGKAITLRTSIIGHELVRKDSLLEWFLGQSGSIKGYTKAIFSGFPTCELARIIRDVVVPNEDLKGLYHLSADAIDKFHLLQLIGAEYGHEIELKPDDKVRIDRSLDSTRFRNASGFAPSDWKSMISEMKQFG